MPDYKIKFEYKGMGKQSFTNRQKAIQAQRAMGRASSGAGAIGTKEFIGTIKNLNDSIKKLIASNKHLETVISKTTPGGPGGAGGGPPSRGGGGGRVPNLLRGGAGFGRMGASIPILGAGIAALGFTIQKINQIGNAYIEKTSQQIGNVGVGGFRYGQGAYMGAEIGAGMKAFGMGRGRFANKAKIPKSALDIGAVFGLSAPEILSQAGVFQRAGGNLGKTAYQAAGMGIQTDLPALLSGIASTLEEAVKMGINTSDMAQDLGKEIAGIALHTPGQSVEAAFGIGRAKAAVKAGLERGKMGGFEGLYGTRAIRGLLSERLNREGYIEQLGQQGYISAEQQQKLVSMRQKGGINYNQLTRMNPNLAQTLFKKQAGETSPVKLALRTTKEIQKEYGTTPEAFQRFSTIADQMGWSLQQSQRKALWDTVRGGGTDENLMRKGRDIITGKTKDVFGSRASMGARQQQMRENLILSHGQKFADASLRMGQAMIKIASSAAPAAERSLMSLSATIERFIQFIDTIVKKSGKTTQNQLDFSSPMSGMSQILKSLY